MVYCGPPSKGCSSCRDRKVRCDQREPGCGQCEKRQQQCPGYRNMVDLMFRDESSHVIKKAQAKQRRRIASARTPEPAPSPDSGIRSALSSSTALPRVTTPTIPSTPVKIGSRPKGLTLRTPGTLKGNGGSSRSGSSGSSSGGGSTPAPLKVLEPQFAQQSLQSPQPTSDQQQAPQQQPSQEQHGPLQQPQQQQQQQQEQEQPLIWAPDESLLPSPDSGSWPATPMIARMYNIKPTCQERGTAFFFSRYVTMDENVSHQRFDFLYDIWQPGSLAAERQLDGVMASMTAVGLVGISQLTHSDETIDSARKSYGTALCLINAALRDPEQAVKDTTMLSILILGVFELMAEPAPKTMQTWHDHINGAVELAKLRGASQFQTPAGIRMFNMLCESVSISCMQRQVPMPAELVALQSVLFSSHTVEHEPGRFRDIDLSRPMYKLLQARHDVKRTDLPGDLDGLLARMDDIEAEFDRTISAFPSDCYYKVFKVTRAHKAVFRDVCHVYPSIAAATVWNLLRAGRILVLETVLSAIQTRFPDIGDDGELVPKPYVTAFRQAWVKLERVTSAIVASVPQHFSLLSPVNPYFDSLKPMPNTAVPLSTTEVREPPTPPAQSPISSLGSTHTTPSVQSDDRGDDDAVFDDGGPSLHNPTRGRSPEEEAERHMLLASATNAIVWPLFVVGASSVCGPQLKAYVVSRLGAIFDETGLNQARSVASIIRNREIIKSPWLKLFQQPANNHMAPPTSTTVRKSLLSASS